MTLPLPPRLSPRRRPHAGLLRAGRALSWLASVSALVILLGSGGAWLYVRGQFSDIRSISGLCLRDCAHAPTEAGATENFLLVGTDTRVAGSYGNSDTTLLVHLSRDRQKVVAISFPRDLLVSLDGRTEKFNAAYARGGPQLLVHQVEQLTNLPVDHYLSIDFSGFQGMVDALGGVQICLSQDAYDPGIPGVTGGSGFKMSKGRHTLTGAQALQYVRQRDGLPHYDLDRIQRQQRFLSAIVRKATSSSVLLNPLTLSSFVSAITRNVTKDSDTGIDDLLGLVSRLKGLSPAAVEFDTVPTLDHVVSPTLGDYLPVNGPAAHVLFQAVHDDKDPAARKAPAPRAQRASAPPPPAAPLVAATDDCGP